ncbi:hypothetical protein HDU99_000649, partial [Rhizoclosmatium hyalinum]
MQLQSLFTLLLAAAAAAQDVSAPSVGQKNRYRALPRGSNLALVPVDGAEFLAGQKFDISIELHGADEKVVPDLSNLSITINGKKVKDVIVDAPAAPYLFNYTSTYDEDLQSVFSNKPSVKFSVNRASFRNIALP